MAWQPDYCSLAELKAFLRITDVVDDAELGVAITAASRAIDQACNRQFGQTAAPEERSFPYDGTGIVEVEDIATTTGLVFDTLTTADMLFYPANALLLNRPIEAIGFREGFSHTPTDGFASITATWGWPAVPDGIKQATLLQASRFHKRRDAPFGVAGSPELGSEIRLLARLDPDVALLTNVYKRHWGIL